MFSPFITDLEFLTFADYPGLIARCCFSTAAYRDEAFPLVGIDLPEHLVSAVPKRRAEYLAGRYLARQVLGELGHHNFTLLRGEDRAPLWPQGIAGAISHNTDMALCAVHRENGMGGIGIDVETRMLSKRAEALWSGIVSKEECAWLRQQPQAFDQLLTLVFSAKESLFKALYPQVRHYFDFLDARFIQLNLQQQTFELELLKTLTPQCHIGRRFTGHFLFEDDTITTMIYF
ncbi:4'-phosphopantetheinyl transferase [Chania multitudinisentens RB-25]|uniref:Enterobactin synthase component D n=1 Tax=Chania multitudinisentens RB-25 TaxID=1441930 RepID=W0L4K2_9GAMM|nr:4'-phosphopantetheinyl transferase superfamily protein [Chania multitudinisentens]AHG18641.1 4'-phosphopantetheinyl transferase [Chania multitudinisentens RB-25]